jgi:hypothetical protein
MPNIRQFDTPALDIRPTETGVQATAAAARRGGAFFNQAAEDMTGLGNRIAGAVRDVGEVAVDFAQHREISAGAAEFAKMHAQLTDAWNNTVKNADPNDTSVASKFNDQVLQPALDKFSGAFNTEGGQRWAEQHVDSLRNHMFERATADMSTMAGAAVATNVRKMENEWSNTARKDPSSVPYLLSSAESSVDSVVRSSPGLTPAAAAKVRNEVLQRAKEEIVKAGALGAIEKSSDPEKAAASFAARWPEYVNAQEIDQFAKAAKSFKRMNDAEGRAARQQQDYEAKNDFNKKINDLETATMPKNTGDPPQLPGDYWQKLRDLATHPGAALEPGRLRTMVTQGEAITDRLNKPEPMARPSHAETMKLLTQIRASDESRLTSTSPIYDAYQAGKLTNGDFNFLVKEFTNFRTPEGAQLANDRGEFFKRYAGTIDAGLDEMGTHSALGQQQMYAAEMDARRQEDMLRKKGLDPHLVYDPRSEYFFGRPDNIMKYHVSLQDALRARSGGNLTGPGKTVTGVEVIDQPAGAKPFVPPNTWQWSPSRQQYRDAAGKIYDVSGNPVK